MPQKNTVRQTAAGMWALAKPYWVSSEWRSAWGLLAVVVALNLAIVYMSVQFNLWNNVFYNALQQLDASGFRQALLKFSWMAVIWIILQVYSSYLQQMLQLRWRRWMTHQFLGDWFQRQAYYRLHHLTPPVDNPDQRIAEDVNQFTATALALSLGLLSSVVTLFSFITILWTLSGSLSFTLFGHALTVPGYMVWVALLYALGGTIITMWIGWPLVKLNYQQQWLEANFRFGLLRVRENSESVALYRGETPESQELKHRFTHVFGNFFQLMLRQKKLTWFTAGYSQIAIIFPIVVAAPRFFAKQIELGGLMQISSAFAQVQGALSFFIGAYPTLANWQATSERLFMFRDGLDRARALEVLAPRPQGRGLRVEGLAVSTPDARPLLTGVSFDLAPGDSLLIRGRSGCGKSTLMRALAGIWPYAQGQMLLPQDTRTLFLSQRPYIPLGTLRQALYYPGIPPEHDDAATLDMVLDTVALTHLRAQLDEAAPWQHILSVGEQQRVAFARVLLNRPDVVFLDEASSALDEELEAQLYHAIGRTMAQGIVVSIGHRAALLAFHAQHIDCADYLAPAI